MHEFLVQGMRCGGCAAGMTNALKAVDKAAEVTVDLSRKSVQVRSTSSPVDLRNAIERAGYRVMNP